MKVDHCIDPEQGSRLFAYEIGALEPEDVDRFELHILECAHCFEAAQRFSRYAAMLREDKLIAGEIAKSAGVKSPSGWPRWRRYFWPDIPLPFRPAFLYLVILILIIPASMGIFQPDPPGFDQMQAISLSPVRSTGNETFSMSAGRDGVIVFIYDGAIRGRNYTVSVESNDGSVIFVDETFTAFDNFQAGWLKFPLELMKPGKYRLEIYDASEHPTGNRQTYQFEIVE